MCRDPVGHATDDAARTGCTVILGPFRAACDVRGAATGTRELDAISHLHLVEQADAILLTGGSAFGLAAADGVMAWLEEQGTTASTPASPASPSSRPPCCSTWAWAGPTAGRARPWAAPPAPRRAWRSRRGASAPGPAPPWASSWALAGAMPGGVGTASAPWQATPSAPWWPSTRWAMCWTASGRIIAGARADGRPVRRLGRLARERLRTGPFAPAGSNTTLVVVATDAPLDRSALTWLARAGPRARPAGPRPPTPLRRRRDLRRVHRGRDRARRARPPPRPGRHRGGCGGRGRGTGSEGAGLTCASWCCSTSMARWSAPRAPGPGPSAAP
jgi:L-aminopeptidase/D-esterase-like protein